MEQRTFINLSAQTPFLRGVVPLKFCLIIRRNTAHVTPTVKYGCQALQCSCRTIHVGEHDSVQRWHIWSQVTYHPSNTSSGITFILVAVVCLSYCSAPQLNTPGWPGICNYIDKWILRGDPAYLSVHWQMPSTGWEDCTFYLFIIILPHGQVLLDLSPFLEGGCCFASTM